jgi:hypothetical protein
LLLQVDCLSSPVPFAYGLLTSYASRVLANIGEPDASELTIIDVTCGKVYMFLDRNDYLAASAAS